MYVSMFLNHTHTHAYYINIQVHLTDNDNGQLGLTAPHFNESQAIATYSHPHLSSLNTSAYCIIETFISRLNTVLW